MRIAFQMVVLWCICNAAPYFGPHQPEWGAYYDHENKGPGTYSFGYDVEDPSSRNVQYRREQRLPNGTVIGSYGLVEPDGNIRIVHYEADEMGYRAVIENSLRPNEYHPPMAQDLPGDGHNVFSHNWDSLWNNAQPPQDGQGGSTLLTYALQSLDHFGTPVLEQHTPPIAAYNDGTLPHRLRNLKPTKDSSLNQKSPVGTSDQSQSYPSFLPRPKIEPR